MQANTFSIAARCSSTGMLGVAVSTAGPAVGSPCPHVRAGVGAVSTQAWVNPYLGFRSIEVLAGGVAPEEALAAVLADDAAKDVGRWQGFRPRVHTGVAVTGGCL